jgi:hypothetical protein
MEFTLEEQADRCAGVGHISTPGCDWDGEVAGTPYVHVSCVDDFCPMAWIDPVRILEMSCAKLFFSFSPQTMTNLVTPWTGNFPRGVGVAAVSGWSPL